MFEALTKAAYAEATHSQMLIQKRIRSQSCSPWPLVINPDVGEEAESVRVDEWVVLIGDPNVGQNLAE